MKDKGGIENTFHMVKLFYSIQGFSICILKHLTLYHLMCTGACTLTCKSGIGPHPNLAFPFTNRQKSGMLS